MDCDVLYSRLGHQSVRVLSNIVFSCNMHTNINKDVSFCSSCQFGKRKKLLFFFLENTKDVAKPFEIIHIDL